MLQRGRERECGRGESTKGDGGKQGGISEECFQEDKERMTVTTPSNCSTAINVSLCISNPDLSQVYLLAHFLPSPVQCVHIYIDLSCHRMYMEQ